MDVQTESTEPPPSDSQSSGKIRKGFKLFGKRKPGNIFSIRSKSEGNNKSPLHRSKTLDVPDSAVNDSEDQDKEKIEGDQETEEGPLGEDGVLAAAPARTSISSASSAKSMGFLSILRGGRRGVGDRRVQTVSQPVGRQRRGIKGLFGNVKFRSKEKEEKEEVPPSPLLMSSRSNSVEIIKEDLTLTPKSQPRSLDSPGTDSSEHTNKSLTAQDSSATSPSRTVTPGCEPNESQSTTQGAMVPGETSLSTLLADISSLLTFDSISGGGDIMADVEAEWGKASAAITPSHTSFSKPLSSPISSISTSISPKPVNSTLTTLPSSTTPSSPMKPSSIITTLTKSTTPTTPTIKPTNEMVTNITTSATKPSTTLSTNISAPIMSSPAITMKTTLGITTSITTPPNTPATATKAPSASPTLTSTVNKLSSESTETPKTVSSMSFVATPPAAMVNPPKTTPFTWSSTSKPDLTSSFPAASFNKVPVTVSMSYPITGQLSPLAPLITSKPTTTEVTSATTSLSTTNITTSAQLCTADQNTTSMFLLSEISSSTAATFTKTQVSSASVSTISKSPTPPTSATAAPIYLNGTLPTQPSMPAPALTQISKVPSSSLSVSKEGPLSISQPKISPAPSEMPSFLSKMPTPTSQIFASSPQIPFASTTMSAHPPLSQTSSCPVSSTPLSRDGLVRKRDSDPCSADENLTSPKTPEPRDVLQEDSHQIKEDKKRTSQGHSTGLSKIPVVGGGRVGKIPVRISQNTEEVNKDTTASAPEESTPHVNSHDARSKDKIAISEVAVVTSKHSQEESQMVPKAPASSPRDSKIPVKHGSQIPQANRTKIPVSKVPVRRAAGAKPAAQSGSMQVRK